MKIWTHFFNRHETMTLWCMIHSPILPSAWTPSLLYDVVCFSHRLQKRQCGRHIKSMSTMSLKYSDNQHDNVISSVFQPFPILFLFLLRRCRHNSFTSMFWHKFFTYPSIHLPPITFGSLFSSAYITSSPLTSNYTDSVSFFCAS